MGMAHRAKIGNARRLLALGVAVATACCGLAGVASASTPPNSLTGFGAPVKKFAAEHADEQVPGCEVVRSHDRLTIWPGSRVHNARLRWIADDLLHPLPA